jgi:hypothetical protein
VSITFSKERRHVCDENLLSVKVSSLGIPIGCSGVEVAGLILVSLVPLKLPFLFKPDTFL